MIAYTESYGVKCYQDDGCGTGDCVIVLPGGSWYRTTDGSGTAAFVEEIARVRGVATTNRVDYAYDPSEPKPEEPGNPPKELPKPRLAYVERKRPRMTCEQVWARSRSPPGNIQGSLVRVLP